MRATVPGDEQNQPGLEKSSERLLVISASPTAIEAEQVRLDTKFVEGLEFVSETWAGTLEALLTPKTDPVPFGAVYDPQVLPFELSFLTAGEQVTAAHLKSADVVLCSGDNAEYFNIAELCRTLGKRLFFIIELDLETRIRIALLDRSRSLPRRLRTVLWHLSKEVLRRRAFRLATGIQANGYPAFQDYSRLNNNTMHYLDNRVGQELLATREEQLARKERLQSGTPLRLIHSGRLEPLKGTDDLIVVGKELARHGIAFQLDVFGKGSLEETLRAGFAEAGLADRLKLHGAVDFQSVLVPFTRQHADIFVSCHRQSDPSCTYIEAMGCGVPVLGYANRMWAALSEASSGGWSVPFGRPERLAKELIRIDSERAEITRASEQARAFAEAHEFRREFDRRIRHLEGALNV